jgi:DNA-binding NtrC family response regulator
VRELSNVLERAAYFLARGAALHGRAPLAIAPEALARLEAHPWPGNVRELSNVLERAVVFARGPRLEVEDLPAHIQNAESPASPVPRAISVLIGTPLKDVEELLIRKTLEATSGDKNLTAKLLGINSRTIYRKLEKDSDREPEAEA